jgi:hypothetical protein
MQIFFEKGFYRLYGDTGNDLITNYQLRSARKNHISLESNHLRNNGTVPFLA